RAVTADLVGSTAAPDRRGDATVGGFLLLRMARPGRTRSISGRRYPAPRGPTRPRLELARVRLFAVHGAAALPGGSHTRATFAIPHHGHQRLQPPDSRIPRGRPRERDPAQGGADRGGPGV